MKAREINSLFAWETRWFNAFAFGLEARWPKHKMKRVMAKQQKAIEAVRQHQEFHPFVLTVEL